MSKVNEVTEVTKVQITRINPEKPYTNEELKKLLDVDDVYIDRVKVFERENVE